MTHRSPRDYLKEQAEIQYVIDAERASANVPKVALKLVLYLSGLIWVYLTGVWVIGKIHAALAIFGF